MIKNLLNNSYLVLAIFTMLLGCNIIKPRQNNEEEIKSLSHKKLMKSINENQFDYEWLRLKGDANIVLQGENEKIKANFRLRSDSIIWMNFSKASFQLLTSIVGKDSVGALIKYPEKKYFSGSFIELKKMIGIELSFKLIEDILIGRMIGVNKSKKTNVQIKGDKYFLEFKNLNSELMENNYTIQYWINPTLLKCDSISVYVNENETKMNVSYNNWEQIETQYFPMNVNFNFTSLSDTVSLDLQYKSPLKINEKQNFPFKISTKYTPLIIE
jgi:hypothetical protein